MLELTKTEVQFILDTLMEMQATDEVAHDELRECVVILDSLVEASEDE